MGHFQRKNKNERCNPQTISRRRNFTQDRNRIGGPSQIKIHKKKRFKNVQKGEKGDKREKGGTNRNYPSKPHPESSPPDAAMPRAVPVAVAPPLAAEFDEEERAR